MRFLQSLKYKTVLTILAVFTALATMAQTTNTTAAQPVQSSYNQLATLLVVMIVVLAFVIWGMGRVLTALGRQLLDKHKMSKTLTVIVLLAAFTLFSQGSFAQDAVAKAVAEIPNYGGLSANTYYFFLIVLGLEVLVIIFMAIAIRRMYMELLPETDKAIKRQSALSAWWNNLDKKIFTRAVPVEKEADVLLDHDYDGIKELDNSLPPWWKYGFYVTIGVGLVYLLNFHVMGNGLNPTQEYAAEMEKAKIEKEAYEATNKDRIDENKVPMADAAGISAGKALFETNCVACHLKDGGGAVGPNLTDEYWLHKGSLNDVYHTIKYGYADKGMQAWGGTFSEKEISYLASYVKSLKGTKPAVAKAPQGDLYTEEPAAADSAKSAKPDSARLVKSDSIATKK